MPVRRNQHSVNLVMAVNSPITNVNIQFKRLGQGVGGGGGIGWRDGVGKGWGGFHCTFHSVSKERVAHLGVSATLASAAWES